MDQSFASLHVVLIEDQPNVASAIDSLFSEVKECELHSFPALKDFLKNAPAAPDLVLLSHEPGGEDNFDALDETYRRYKRVYVIVSLNNKDEAIVDRYLEAGVNGFVFRGPNYLTDFTSAVKKAMIRIVEKKSFLSASLSKASFFSPDRDLEVLHDFAALQTGQMILHYRIVDSIGEGGMGEVYRAYDTKLGRQVAIKILPPKITANHIAKKRLIHEAQTASALNHPNIVTIHAIEQADEMSFIVMEYVEGRSLSHILQDGPLELSQALDYAGQIADALDSAHRRGLIHRDIKPANIMISAGGTVKLLDFGLAKWSTPHENETKLTASGQTVGTVMYMSPEQARGEDLDSRSDLFSFGSVLYEMATNRAAFGGDTSALIFDAILNRQPVSPLQLNPKLPLEFEHIVLKALEKDRDLRYQSVSELRADLKRLRRDSATSGEAPSVEIKKASSKPLIPVRYRAHVTAAVMAILLLSFLLVRLLQRDRNEITAAKQTTFTQLTDFGGLEFHATISPDGNLFAYSRNLSGNTDIFLQRVGGSNPINLTASSIAGDTSPAFSPDGQTIAFRSEREGGGIFLMGATGESVRRLADFGYTPAWSPDGKEIAVTTAFTNNPDARGAPISELYAINVESGTRRLITKKDAMQPSWSPHGHRIAYWGLTGVSVRNLWTIPSNGGDPVAVTDDVALDWSPCWAPDGKHLYFASNRGGTMNLWRVAIDEQTGKLLGDPEPLTTPSRFAGQIGISANGNRLIFVSFDRRSNIAKMRFDPDTEKLEGPIEYVTTGTSLYRQPHPSPDERWVAFRSMEKEDLFIAESSGTNLRRLTDDFFKDRAPVWSVDGKRIAFYSDRNVKYQPWSIRPDGSQLKLLGDTTGWFPQWSPTGNQVAASNTTQSFILDLVSDVPGKVRKNHLPQMNPKRDVFVVSSWSRDGNWLAGGVYGLEGKGKPGVYIYSIAAKKFELLSAAGEEVVDEVIWWCSPRWLSDSRRLLFQTRTGLWLIDRLTREKKEIFAFPRGSSYLDPRLSMNDRTLYFAENSVQSDIWMLSL